MIDTFLDMIPKASSPELVESQIEPKRKQNPEIAVSQQTKKSAEFPKLVAVRKDLGEMTIGSNESDLVEKAKDLLQSQSVATGEQLSQEFIPYITTISVAGEFRSIRYDELYEQYYIEGVNGHLDELMSKRVALYFGLCAISLLAKLIAPKKNAAKEQSGLFHEMIEGLKQDLKLHIQVLTAAIHAVKGDFSVINGLVAREQASLDNRQERQSGQIVALEQNITSLGGSEHLMDYKSNYIDKSDALETLQNGTEKEKMLAAMLLRRNSLVKRNKHAVQRRAWLEHLDDPRTYTAQPRARGFKAVVEEFKALWTKPPRICIGALREDVSVQLKSPIKKSAKKYTDSNNSLPS